MNDALVVQVRLTPRGGRDSIDGVETLADGRSVLKVRVRAVPEKGLANGALEELLADSLGVAKSAVSVIAGAASRVKAVRVAGDPAVLGQRLRALAGGRD
jgi:uncharacterized protein YggU (UPF0235/DUF167 family)